MSLPPFARPPEDRPAQCPKCGRYRCEHCPYRTTSWEESQACPRCVSLERALRRLSDAATTVWHQASVGSA